MFAGKQSPQIFIFCNISKFKDFHLQSEQTSLGQRTTDGDQKSENKKRQKGELLILVFDFWTPSKTYNVARHIL